MGCCSGGREPTLPETGTAFPHGVQRQNPATQGWQSWRGPHGCFFFLSVKPFSNTILHGFPIFETDMRKAVLTKAEVGVRDIPFYAYSPRHSEAPWWKLLGSAGQWEKHWSSHYTSETKGARADQGWHQLALAHLIPMWLPTLWPLRSFFSP